MMHKTNAIIGFKDFTVIICNLNLLSFHFMIIWLYKLGVVENVCNSFYASL